MTTFYLWLSLALCYFADGAAVRQAKDICPAKFYGKEGHVLTVLDDSCYRYITDDRKSWQDAQGLCEKDGGNLAVISSWQEQDHLYTVLNFLRLAKNAWIGLRRNQIKDPFTQWVDGSRVGYTNWMDNEGLAGTGGYCVVINMQNAGHWAERKCPANTDVQGYVCEYRWREPSATVKTTTVATTPAPTTTTPLSTPIPTITATPTTTTPTPPTQPPTTTPLPTTTTPSPPPPTTLPTPTETTPTITAQTTFAPTTTPTPTPTETPTPTPTPTSTAQTTSASTTATTTPPPTESTSPPTTATTNQCSDFNCDADCGMNGYKLDLTTGCSLCECNGSEEQPQAAECELSCNDLDCGMSGYVVDPVTGCTLCECNA